MDSVAEEPEVEAQVCGQIPGDWHRPRPRRLQAAARVRRGGEVSRGPRSGVMGCQRPGREERGRQHSSVRAGLWPLTTTHPPEPGPGG